MTTKDDLVRQLQDVTADLFTEFISYKYRHWHTQGMTFIAHHEWYDETTNTILGFLDTIGEYVVSFKADAPANLSQIVGKYNIPIPDYGDNDPKKLLESALESSQYLKRAMTRIDQTAQEVSEFGVANAVEGIIESLDKIIYKLQQFLNLGPNDVNLTHKEI